MERRTLGEVNEPDVQERRGREQGIEVFPPDAVEGGIDFIAGVSTRRDLAINALVF
jgi:hypothetical protein